MMKSTGIVRKVDELGRIVLPKELRDTHNINIKDPLEIYVDGDRIILKKYEPSCVFCGSVDQKFISKENWFVQVVLQMLNRLVHKRRRIKWFH